MNRKLLIAIGILVALAIAGLVYFTRIGITPADTKIIEILYNNEENLLSILSESQYMWKTT